MTIRECEVSDYERIYHLNKTALGYDYDPEKTKGRLAAILARKTDKIFVACVDGVVAGYVHAIDYECVYTDSLKNIMAIAVDEEYRCRGVGRALVTAVEDWARECGAQGVRLVSSMFREGAHAFYLRCGYHVRKTYKNFVKYFT
jgi:GNAT superfamily N-acetyltransferase